MVKSDIKSESEFKPLPPPTAAETHGNLKTKLVRTPKKPLKGLVQCNSKVRPRTRERFEEAYDRARKVTADAGEDLTKGDFFELLLAAFEAQEKGGNLVDAAKLVGSPQQSDQDRQAGRTEHLEVFATPDLARALKTRSKEKGWTISDTVEHACAEAMALKREPCPHCGKPRSS
jgi:hypothetical protein